MAEVGRYLLIFIEVACSFLLIGVILLQQSKGQGLGLGFGQAMGETFLGAQAGNVLTKTTVILAIVFFANTLLLAHLYSDQIRGGSIMEDYSDLQPVPVAPQLQDPQFAQPPEGEALSPSSATTLDSSSPQAAPIAPPPAEVTTITFPPADATPVEIPAEVEPVQIPPIEDDAAAPAPSEGS